jgi:hypothetical protein
VADVALMVGFGMVAISSVAHRARRQSRDSLED